MGAHSSGGSGYKDVCGGSGRHRARGCRDGGSACSGSGGKGYKDVCGGSGHHRARGSDGGSECSGSEEDEPEPEFHHPFSKWQRRYITFMFTLQASLLFADQNLLAPNVSAAELNWVRV